MDGRSRVKCFLESEEETIAFAKEFAKLLIPGDVLLLEGDLGSGKTTFVKGLVSALVGDSYDVCSPTFIYVNLYDHIAHFDLYRLDGARGFIEKGFSEYLEEPFISCIEWPDRIKEILPERAYKISLTYKNKGREIEVTKHPL